MILINVNTLDAKCVLDFNQYFLFKITKAVQKWNLSFGRWHPDPVPDVFIWADDYLYYVGELRLNYSFRYISGDYFLGFYGGICWRSGEYSPQLANFCRHYFSTSPQLNGQSELLQEAAQACGSVTEIAGLS